MHSTLAIYGKMTTWPETLSFNSQLMFPISDYHLYCVFFWGSTLGQPFPSPHNPTQRDHSHGHEPISGDMGMRSNHSLIWAKAGPVEVRYKWKAKPAQTFAVEIYVAIIIMWQMTCCVGVVLGYVGVVCIFEILFQHIHACRCKTWFASFAAIQFTCFCL